MASAARGLWSPRLPVKRAWNSTCIMLLCLTVVTSARSMDSHDQSSRDEPKVRHSKSAVQQATRGDDAYLANKASIIYLSGMMLQSTMTGNSWFAYRRMLHLKSK